MSKYEKALGIWFDSENLRWKLPEGKEKKTQGRIVDALTNEKVNLLQMQKLFESLNDISLMCLFLRGFKKPLKQPLEILAGKPLCKAKTW